MKIRIKGKHYNIFLIHKIIPKAIVQIIRTMNGEPKDKALVINGNKLAGKVALVTGAHKGIGYAIAKRLLQDGSKVIITGRNEQQLLKAVKSLGTPNVASMVWDISDRSNCSSYFGKAESFFGKIDILVNNAGVNQDGKGLQTFEQMTKDYLHCQHDINVLGTVQMCKKFEERGIGRENTASILNILSNCAVRGAKDAYWMSKWALLSFTKAFAKESKNLNNKLTVNGLCPGPTKTDMMFNVNSSLYNKNMKNKRMGLPEEIAELAFIQIISGLYNGVNGMITVCDGGESLN